MTSKRRSTPPVQLTDREVEVLQLVAEGLSNADVGARLHITRLTVKSHLTRIGEVLGTGSRTAMVAFGFREGYLK